MEIIIIIICLGVYIISMVLLGEFYEDRNVTPSFVSIMIILTPIINTYVLIRYVLIRYFKRFDFTIKESFDKFIKEIS